MGRVVKADREGIRMAVEILRAGGLVIFPSETFYGLAADHANPEALERLFALKGREPGKPVGLILSRATEAEELARDIPPAARELMSRHWPGPLTLVLQARPGLHPGLTSADGGVGMRLSPHPVAAALAEGLGRSITATSANPAGGEPVSLAEGLEPGLVRGAGLMLDDGACPGGPASTVLDVRVWPPLVLRPGAVEIPGAAATPNR